MIYRESMSSALTSIVEHLTAFNEESAKISSCTAQLTQCHAMLQNIEELKKEGGQAVSKLTQR